jgi:hypothetical protein
VIEKMPVAPAQIDDLFGVDYGYFYNQINESIRRISGALRVVQTGLGWVLPMNLIEQKFLHDK